MEAWRERDLAAFKESLPKLPHENYYPILESIAQVVSPESRGFAEALLASTPTEDLLHKNALHIAAQNLNLPILEILVKNNADINHVDSESNTILHLLAKKVKPILSQQHEKCLDWVLSQPQLYLNHANAKNMTPLLTAFEQGAWTVMHKLLKAGAIVEDLDYKTIGGKSLREEIHQRCPEILHELPNAEFPYSRVQPEEIKALSSFLDSSSEDRFSYEFNMYMADMQQRNSKEAQNDCLEFLDVAIERQLIKASETLVTFITQNFPISDMKENILTNALTQSCKIGNPKLVQIILDQQTDKTIGQSALEALVEEYPFTENHANCLKKIIKHSNIHQINNHGETPLHQAVQTDNIAAMTILLENGANIFQTDDQGRASYELIPNDLFQTYLNEKIEKLFDRRAYYFNLEFLNPNTKTENEDSELSNLRSKTCKPEMDQLCQFAESAKGNFITHPVFQAFLTQKWQSCLPFFYITVLLSTIFDVTLLIFVIDTLRNDYPNPATRIILIIFLTFFIVFSVIFFPSLKSLTRGNRWLSYVLLIFSLAILSRNSYFASDWSMFVYVSAGILAGVHWFSVIGLHPRIGGPSLILSQKIFLNFLMSSIPYVLACFVIHTTIWKLSTNNIITHIFQTTLLFIFLVHFIGLGVHTANKILKNRNYYQLKQQANLLADFEEMLLTRWQFFAKYVSIPELKRIENIILFFAQHDDRLRLNLNRGNILEGFARKKKTFWWTRPATLNNTCVRQVRDIYRTHVSEKRSVISTKESDLQILLKKTDALNDRMRCYLGMLEKLDNKNRDLENLLIQSMRVNSLRDDEI